MSDVSFDTRRYSVEFGLCMSTRHGQKYKKIQMQFEKSSVPTFSQGTLKWATNSRLAAVERANANKHSIANQVNQDRTGLTDFMRNYYERDQLPDPVAMSKIEARSIGTPELELKKLAAFPADGSHSLDALVQIYRVALAGIATEVTLPIAYPTQSIQMTIS